MRTKRLVLFLVVFFICASILTLQSPKTHIYFTEYKKAVSNVHVLDTIFFIKVSPKQAGAILRAELECIVKQFPPNFDVLATAWYSPKGISGEEDMIILSEEGSHLVYSVKTGKISYLTP